MSTTNGHTKKPHPQPKYLFLSHPRTGSALLMRMLSHQPRLTQGEYFMTSKMDMMLESDFETTNTDTKRRKYLPKFQEAFIQLQNYVTAFERGEDMFKEIYASRAEPLASDGDILIFKEHIIMLWDPSISTERPSSTSPTEYWTLNLESYHAPLTSKTNPTLFPDEFFDSWKPFMLIRHPALTFPSFYRASKKAFGTGITHPWVVLGNSYRMDRIMYDWYERKLGADVSSSGRCDRPLVLEMYDMVNDPLVVEKFCGALGLDAQCLRYEWTAAPKKYVEEQKAHLKYFLSSIQASEGVLTEKAPQCVSLAVEYVKWVEEWGAQDADILRQQVENTMDDYEYLGNKRLVV